MEYGIKYIASFVSEVIGYNYEIRILERDYAGTPMHRNLGGAPELIKDNNGAVCGTSLEFLLETNTDGDLREFYTEDNKKFKVEVWQDDELFWVGFVVTEVYAEAMVPVADISIRATDGLGLLKNEPYTKSGECSLLDIIRFCTGKTGLMLEFDFRANIAIAGSQHLGSFIQYSNDVNAEVLGIKENCYDALVALLDTFALTITQSECRWVIRQRTLVARRLIYTSAASFSQELAQSVIAIGKAGQAGTDAFPVGALDMVVEPARKNISVTEKQQTLPSLLDNWNFTEGNSWSGGSYVSIGEENCYYLAGIYKDFNAFKNISQQKSAFDQTESDLYFELKYAVFTNRSDISHNLWIHITLTSINGTVYLLTRNGWKTGNSIPEERLVFSVSELTTQFGDTKWNTLKIYISGIPEYGELGIKIYNIQAEVELTAINVGFYLSEARLMLEIPGEISRDVKLSSPASKDEDFELLFGDKISYRGVKASSMSGGGIQGREDGWCFTSSSERMSFLDLMCQVWTNMYYKPRRKLSGTLLFDTPVRGAFENDYLYLYDHLRYLCLAGSYNLLADEIGIELIEVDDFSRIIPEATLKSVRSVNVAGSVYRISSAKEYRTYNTQGSSGMQPKMIRELAKVKELAETYLFEVDNGFSGSSEKLELKAFLEFLAGKYWTKEEIKFLQGYLYYLGEKIKSGYSDESGNSEQWDRHIFADYLNQALRTTDNVEFASVVSERVKSGLITSGNISSEDFASGPLGRGHRIKDGSAEFDNLSVRGTFSIFELLIQQLRAVGGQFIVSPASIKIARVEEGEDGYKCFFNTDGGTIPNPFVIGDQLIHQVFTGQHISRYWRLVSSTGAGYFVLSKTDCEAGSGIPLPNDEVMLLGNRTDVSRQNAILITAHGLSSPYIAYYSGINAYSLIGKELVREGNLEGIVDSDFGQLHGFGLYANNVYLKGVFRLVSGKTVEESIHAGTEVVRQLAEAAQSTADTSATIAAEARQAATNAQVSANTANFLLADIASDNKLTPAEKQETKKEWDIIVSEKADITAQGAVYELSTVAYTNAYNTLSSYITPLLSDLTATSDIVGMTFRTNFKNYYDARTALLKAVTDKARQLTGTAQTAANTAKTMAEAAQTTADAAKTAAANAQASSSTANALLADIANDNKLTPQEKQTTKKEWDIIVSEKATVTAQGTAYGISTTAYTNAYNALNTYITPLLSSLTTTSMIVGSTFRTNFRAYYDARTALLKGVSDRAKQLADAAQTAANAANSGVTSLTTRVTKIETDAGKISLEVSSVVTKIDAAKQEAKSYADGVASSAKQAAITAAASDATVKADTAKNYALNQAQQKALAQSWGSGQMLYADPTFKTGGNSIGTYNNSGNGNVIVTRIVKLSDSPVTDSGYNMQIQNKGASSPGLGGFHWSHKSRANAIFIYRIIAKIPVGHNLEFASNDVGTGNIRFWGTSNAGTGKWEEYIFVLRCGASGTFSTTGYFYIDGSVGTAAAPVNWYLAYGSVFDMSVGISTADQAKSAAISVAATDATTKANNAQNAAVSMAATDATTKAGNARNAAKSYTDSRTEAMWKGWIDASGLDQNKYYPVVFYCSPALRSTIRLEVALNSGVKPGWSTHSSGFSVRCVWSVNGNGWGTTPVSRVIEDYSCSFVSQVPVGDIGQMGHSSNEYIYVRGGGKYYFVTTNTDVPSLKTSDYTAREETIGIRTSVTAPVITNATKTELSAQIKVVEDLIGLKVTKTDYDKNNVALNSAIGDLQASYGSISAIVSNMQTTINGIKTDISGVVTASTFVDIFSQKKNELGDSIVSSINVAPGAVRINSAKIEITGQTVFKDSAGNIVSMFKSGKIMSVNGGVFSVDNTGQLVCSKVNITGGYFMGFNLSGGVMQTPAKDVGQITISTGSSSNPPYILITKKVTGQTAKAAIYMGQIPSVSAKTILNIDDGDFLLQRGTAHLAALKVSGAMQLNGVVSGLALKTRVVSSSITLDNDDSIVLTNTTSHSYTIKLPAAPCDGKIIFIRKCNTGNTAISGNGKNIRVGWSGAVTSTTLDNAYMHVYIYSSALGMWLRNFIGY